MYSLMNVGKNYFCNLYGEQIIAEALEQESSQENRGLMEESIKSSVMKRLLDESLYRIRIFIETTGIIKLDAEVMEILITSVKMMLSRENEVFFLGCNEELKDILVSHFNKAGLETGVQYNQVGFWYLEISISPKSSQSLSVDRCSSLVYEIHEDNLRILVEDGAKGKAMNVKHLLDDGEDCIYYFCYRLAVRMVEENLVSKEPLLNQDICLIAGNDAGYYIAKELARILGTVVYTDPVQQVGKESIKNYIIVRDVIHMFCELNSLTSLIEGNGGMVYGSACLIDINTGVGNRKNRASVYTIDLEKGISYRLRNKKIADDTR